MQTPQQVINIGSPDVFNKLVNKFQDKLFVVDMYADWCGPCKSFKSVFERTQERYKEKGVVFLKVNVDQQKEIAQQFRVMSIPTMIFIYNKKIIHSQPGALTKSFFTDLIDKMLKKVESK